MSNSFIKKIPLIWKVTAVLGVLALVFLGLSIGSAVYSVNRTVEAIDAIGEVEYTEASKQKIDLALSYYGALDPNIGLPDQITNIDTLTAAKREYVRLGIKRAYVADKNGEAADTVKQYVTEARANFDEYCASGECTDISNYADLTALEEKYGGGTQAPSQSTPSDSSGGEDIELC
ncbi:MAG: hypothetical protein IJX39_00590 [Clostridia bacterium]|nr:hypothetical protein [Clostridia bacterium]